MKINIPVLAAALAAGFAAPALAADYYVTSRYMGGGNIGELAIAVDSGTIRDGYNPGNKIADLVSISAANRVVTAFTTEINCAEHAWRVIVQKDYRTDRLMAPTAALSPQAAFEAVEKGSENGKAIDFVCGWPASAASAPAASKFTLTDPIALSEKVSPTLKFQLSDPADSAWSGY